MTLIYFKVVGIVLEIESILAITPEHNGCTVWYGEDLAVRVKLTPEELYDLIVRSATEPD